MEYLKEPALVAKIQEYFGVQKTDSNESVDSNDKKGYIIKNKFWYYLFVFGTALGDETFYSVFIPFWFWNIDGAVGRRFVLTWAVVMYIGQGVKDIVRWPRPGPPVVQLQKKWSLEYGMPSTHAMVGVSIPFSILLFTVNRYQYSFSLGLCIAILWCSLICTSRLYLGMHTVLDIIVGLGLAILIMAFMVPVIDYLDEYLLTSPTAPLLLLVTSILMIVYYPNSGKWTPTRGDTTMIVSVSVGILAGAWLNHRTGQPAPPTDPLAPPTDRLAPPHPIMWPSVSLPLLRTALGLPCVLLIGVACRRVARLALGEGRVRIDSVRMRDRHRTVVELGGKYAYCAAIGFGSVCVMPQAFRLLGIERPTFFTEI